MPSLREEPERPRKPWRVDWTERRRRRTKRFATRREAQVFLGDLARGTSAARVERLTLRAWIAQWISTYGPAWEPRTVHDRGDYADRLILPHLGKLRLGEIGRADVRDWRAAMLRAGKTPYVADRAVTVLSAALGAAVDDELIPANPCRGLRRLPRAVNRRRPATLAEVEKVRAQMGEPRDRAVVSLMAYGGLRPGEVRALRWSDVREHTLVVRAAARDGGGEKATKTGSVRSVPIIVSLRDDLGQLERDARGLVAHIPDWRVWSSRVWRPARAAAGTDVPPYALRHTFASLHIAAGLNPWQVAALLGHANPGMVISTYGHLFAEQELAAPLVVEDAVMVERAHQNSVGVMAPVT